MRLDRLAVFFSVAVTLTALPLTAAAQPPPGKVYRIGWLHPLPIPHDWAEAFRLGLRELGYVEGKNVLIENRSGGGVERLAAMAAELVQLNVDVLVSGNSGAVQALKNATSTIPIVMVGTNNPVALGFVTSLARPGGNITGLSGLGDLGPKRLDLLKEVLPGLTRVTMLSNLGNPSIGLVVQETRRPQGHSASNFTLWTCETPPGSIRRSPRHSRLDLTDSSCQPRPWSTDPQARTRIAEFAMKHRLPSIGAWREFAQAGGLMAYGVSIPDVFRRAVGYLDKILRGAKAGDLPVQEPSKLEFVVNLKTAKALGLAIPPSVLARADEVIQ